MGEVKTVMSLKLRSDEASTPKKRGGFVRVVAFSAFILVGLFVVVSIVSSNMKINEYRKQYDDLVTQTAAVEDANDEIRRFLDDGADMSEYIENMARDKLDYARPDERVYYIVPDSGN